MNAEPPIDQDATARIDREWEQERRKHLRADRHGRLREPSILDGWVKAAFFVLFGLIGTVLVVVLSIPGGRAIAVPPFWLWALLAFVLALAGLGLVLSVAAAARAERYSAAKAEYARRRLEAVRREAAGPPGWSS